MKILYTAQHYYADHNIFVKLDNLLFENQRLFKYDNTTLQFVYTNWGNKNTQWKFKNAFTNNNSLGMLYISDFEQINDN